MKKLASVDADIYHKHYADNAFGRTHQQARLENTHIVTYAHYEKLRNTGYFLNQHFFKKSWRPKVIIGIGGLGHKLQRDTFEEQLRLLIKFLPAHVELYVHAACHVKMLSHDTDTVLGSQNISGTSMPYLESGSSSGTRHHEVQIQFKDESLSCAKALFEEILCDPSLHLRLSRNSDATAVATHLIAGFALEGHRRKIDFTRNLGVLLGQDIEHPSHIDYEPTLEKNHYLVTAAAKIYGAAAVTKIHLNELFDILYADGDDFPLNEAFTNYVFEVSSLLEAVSEDTVPDKASLLDVLRAVYSREMPVVEGEPLDEFVDMLKTVIERHHATERGEFVNRHQHRLTHQVMENPDYAERAVSMARDADGNLDEYEVRSALLNDAIDPRRYMDVLDLSDFVADVHKEIEKAYIAAVASTFAALHERHAALLQIYQRELISQP